MLWKFLWCFSFDVGNDLFCYRLIELLDDAVLFLGLHYMNNPILKKFIQMVMDFGPRDVELISKHGHELDPERVTYAFQLGEVIDNQ